MQNDVSIRPEKVYRIFVSSTSRVGKFRACAYQAIAQSFNVPVGMELFLPNQRSSEEISEEYVKSSDFVIFIISGHPGSLTKSGIPYVEHEYNVADKNNIPFVVFAHDDLKNNKNGSLGKVLTILSSCFRQLYYEISRWQGPISIMVRPSPGWTALFIDKISDHQLSYFSSGSDLSKTVSATVENIHTLYCPLSFYINIKNYREWKLSNESLAKAKNLLSVLSQIQNVLSFNLNNKIMSSAGVSSSVTEAVVEYGNQLKALIDSLTSEWSDHPLLLDIANDGVIHLYALLKDITSPHGYTPRDIEEFNALVEKLFSTYLVKLQATSIVSNDDRYKNYRSYWEDPNIGQSFERKNIELLSRDGCVVERVFVCDTLISAVRENWFKNAALPQAKEGARIKLIPLERGDGKGFTDYGIYHHSMNGRSIGTYVLEAPDEKNKESRYLKTRLVSTNIDFYARDFEKLWNKISSEPLEIIDDDIVLPDEKEFGTGTVNDVISNNAVLRDLVLVSSKQSLAQPGVGFVRKNDRQYAEIVNSFIERTYASVSSILYFGDTIDNDGSVIRNLQDMGLPVLGFICEPRLNIGNVLLNGVLHAQSWNMAVKFLRIVAERKICFDDSMLAIFDIDQTLWAPKGLAETAISGSRKDAISEVLCSCFVQSETGAQSLQVSQQIMESTYNILNKMEYTPLTLDNEDFKAAAAIFAGLGLYENSTKDTSHVFGPYLRDRDWEIKNKILNKYNLDKGIQKFTLDALGELADGRDFCAKYGINHDRATKMVNVLWANIRDNKPAPFKNFRAKELEAALRRTSDPDISQAITINKVMRDIGLAFKEAGVKILALSDRPDEATYSDTVSLLQSPMKIFGHDLDDEIRDIVGGQAARRRP